MIIEGLLATLGANGQPHLAVMGGKVNEAWTQLELRPFCETQSCQNLRRGGGAVFHTTDDIDLIVRLIVGDPLQLEWMSAAHVQASIYRGACRYFELTTAYSEQHPPRALFHCQIVGQGELRPSIGFNRARHLVLEAAILATRVAFLPAEEFAQKYAWFEPIIRKTGSPQEVAAFERLQDWVQSQAEPSGKAH